MIIEYHRPHSIPEALELIARTEPLTYPMGGGTILNRPNSEKYAVVDLQLLGLDKIGKSGNRLEVGAAASLAALATSPYLPEALKRALDLEGNFNLRQSASIAGSLVSADGRSPFACAMLALDAELTLANGTSAAKGSKSQAVSLGDLLALRRKRHPGELITAVSIPLNAQLAFERVARTPSDRPLVCAALAQWPSGRTRLALGGWGAAPVLAMDGNESGGVEAAARNASSAAEDEWASGEYRSRMAETLAGRCLDSLSTGKEA